MSQRKSYSVPADNMLRGLTEQVPALRDINTCSESVNLVPDPVHGLVKRPASTFLHLTPDLPEDEEFAYHFYERDKVERYTIAVGGGTARVFDFDTGALRGALTSPYLQHTGPAQNAFRFLTLGDSTFIVNREVEVAMASTTTPAAPNKGLIFVRQGDWETTYTVRIDGNEYVNTTGDSDRFRLATDWIANELYTLMDADLDPNEYTVTLSGSVILVEKSSAAPLELSSKDGQGNTGIDTVVDTVSSFSKLPGRAPDGYTVKVEGAGRTDYDDYYVKFVADDPTMSSSQGVWTEAVGPGISVGIDVSTMPLQLTREANNSFTLTRPAWTRRVAGDDLTNPGPSFIGQKLDDIYFFQNRLGFASKSNIVSSVDGEYFNFWRQSARGVLDTDPVDIAATTSEVTNIRYALPFDGRLLLVADNALLVSSGGAAYTPETASMDILDELEIDTSIRPAVASGRVFIATPIGDSLAISEVSVGEDARWLPPAPVTNDVPSLIKKGDYRMVASSAVKKLFLVPLNHTAPLYTMTWMTRREGRQVNLIGSWGTLEMIDGLVPKHAVFRDNELHLVSRYQETMFRSKMIFDVKGTYQNTFRDAHLDNLTFFQPTPSGGTTTLNLPFSLSDPTILTRHPKGFLYEITRSITANTGATGTGPSTITLSGSFTEVGVGVPYEWRLVPSQPFPKRYGPRGEMVSDRSDRFQLTKYALNLTDTGPFTATVERPYRAPYVQRFSGAAIGSPLALIGHPPIRSDNFRVTCRGTNEEIKITLSGKNWMPFCVTSALWSGTIMRKRG